MNTIKVDVSDTDKIEVLVHAENQPESPPIELEKVANPAQGVFIVDHEDYEGPEISVSVASPGDESNTDESKRSTDSGEVEAPE